MGIYYTRVKVGSPPREFVVSIDTGSTDLLVPGNDCDGCNVTTPKYDPSKSTSSSPVLCHDTSDCTRKAREQPSCWTPGDLCPFSDVYLTCDLSNLTALCSVAGPLYRDIVEIAGFKTSVPVKFGVILNQTTNFDQFKLIDGICKSSTESRKDSEEWLKTHLPIAYLSRHFRSQWDWRIQRWDLAHPYFRTLLTRE